MLSNKSLIIVLLAGFAQAFTPTVPTKTSVALHLSSIAPDPNHLYRQEPTELERKEVKNVHDPEHSSFHVEHGLESVDNKADPVHSVHRHLIDVDHDKLHDLDLRAQKAWLPVNMHEVEVDAVTMTALFFGLLAVILFTVQQ